MFTVAAVVLKTEANLTLYFSTAHWRCVGGVWVVSCTPPCLYLLPAAAAALARNSCLRVLLSGAVSESGCAGLDSLSSSDSGLYLALCFGLRAYRALCLFFGFSVISSSLSSPNLAINSSYWGSGSSLSSVGQKYKMKTRPLWCTVHYKNWQWRRTEHLP